MLIAVILTGLISFIGSLIASFLGFFTIFVAMGAGALAVTVVRKAIKNRKSPLLNNLMTASALIGSLPLLIIRAALILPFFFQVGLEASGSLLSLVWFALYSALVTSTVYYQQRN